MSIVKRKQEEIKETPVQEQPTAPEQPAEEWIWVEGYKGTDENMCCRGYQYDLGKQFDMPEDEKIETCDSGFHLCLKLKSIFNFYSIGDGNRFFKVKALVRKKDKEYAESNSNHGCITWASNGNIVHGSCDKLASKSIIFISELTKDEILSGTDAEKLPDKYKDGAIKNGVNKAVREYQSDTLIQDGYSVAFANSIVRKDLFDKAHAVGSQSDLSMDMKVLWILS